LAASASPEAVASVRATLTTRRTPAAVLVPLVERPAGMTVLLTQRATHAQRSRGARLASPAERIEPEMPTHGTRHCARRTKKSVCGPSWLNSPAICRTMWWYPVFG